MAPALTPMNINCELGAVGAMRSTTYAGAMAYILDKGYANSPYTVEHVTTGNVCDAGYQPSDAIPSILRPHIDSPHSSAYIVSDALRFPIGYVIHDYATGHSYAIRDSNW